MNMWATNFPRLSPWEKEILDCAPSATPKIGDRVRVVIETEVLETGMEDLSGWLRLHGWMRVPPVGYLGIVSIEVIQPPFVLPTKRYAQVLSGGDQLWTLGANRSFDWKDCNGQRLRDDELLQLSALRVISEGVSE